MNSAHKFNSPQEAMIFFSASCVKKGFVYEALHAYLDAEGEPIYWRMRYKHSDGRKWIRPLCLDADGYRMSEPESFKDTIKPLYGLHLLTKYPNARVWIVEGEQCVDELNQFFENEKCLNDNIAVTSGGATSAKDADWTPLRSRISCVWPDNDEIGYKYANDVVEILQRFWL